MYLYELGVEVVEVDEVGLVTGQLRDGRPLAEDLLQFHLEIKGLFTKKYHFRAQLT